MLFLPTLRSKTHDHRYDPDLQVYAPYLLYQELQRAKSLNNRQELQTVKSVFERVKSIYADGGCELEKYFVGTDMVELMREDESMP